MHEPDREIDNNPDRSALGNVLGVNTNAECESVVVSRNGNAVPQSDDDLVGNGDVAKAEMDVKGHTDSQTSTAVEKDSGRDLDHARSEMSSDVTMDDLPKADSKVASNGCTGLEGLEERIMYLEQIILKQMDEIATQNQTITSQEKAISKLNETMEEQEFLSIRATYKHEEQISEMVLKHTGDIDLLLIAKDSVENQLDATQQKYIDTKLSLEESENKMRETKREKEKLITEVEALNLELKSKDESIQTLKDSEAMMGNYIATLEIRVSKAECEIERLNNINAQLGESVFQLRCNYNDAVDEKKMLEDQLSLLNEDLLEKPLTIGKKNEPRLKCLPRKKDNDMGGHYDQRIIDEGSAGKSTSPSEYFYPHNLDDESIMIGNKSKREGSLRGNLTAITNVNKREQNEFYLKLRDCLRDIEAANKLDEMKSDREDGEDVPRGVEDEPKRSDESVTDSHVNTTSNAGRVTPIGIAAQDGYEPDVAFGNLISENERPAIAHDYIQADRELALALFAQENPQLDEDERQKILESDKPYGDLLTSSDKPYGDVANRDDGEKTARLQFKTTLDQISRLVKVLKLEVTCDAHSVSEGSDPEWQIQISGDSWHCPNLSQLVDYGSTIVDDLENHATDLRASLVEMAELKRKLLSAEIKVREMQNQFLDTENPLRETRCELTELLTQLRVTKTELSEVQAQVCETNAELSETQGRLSDTQKKLEEREKQASRLKRYFDKAWKNKLEELSGKTNAGETGEASLSLVSDLQIQMKDPEGRKTELQDLLRNTSEAMIQMLNSRFEDLTAVGDYTKEVLDVFGKLTREINNKEDQFTDDKLKMLLRINQLEEEIAQSLVSRETLQKNIENLKVSSEKLDEKYVEAKDQLEVEHERLTNLKEKHRLEMERIICEAKQRSGEYEKTNEELKMELDRLTNLKEKNHLEIEKITCEAKQRNEKYKEATEQLKMEHERFANLKEKHRLEMEKIICEAKQLNEKYEEAKEQLKMERERLTNLKEKHRSEMEKIICEAKQRDVFSDIMSEGEFSPNISPSEILSITARAIAVVFGSLRSKMESRYEHGDSAISSGLDEITALLSDVEVYLRAKLKDYSSSKKEQVEGLPVEPNAACPANEVSKHLEFGSAEYPETEAAVHPANEAPEPREKESTMPSLLEIEKKLIEAETLLFTMYEQLIVEKRKLESLTEGALRSDGNTPGLLESVGFYHRLLVAQISQIREIFPTFQSIIRNLRRRQLGSITPNETPFCDASNREQLMVTSVDLASNSRDDSKHLLSLDAYNRRLGYETAIMRLGIQYLESLIVNILRSKNLKISLIDVIRQFEESFGCLFHVPFIPDGCDDYSQSNVDIVLNGTAPQFEFAYSRDWGARLPRIATIPDQCRQYLEKLLAEWSLSLEGVIESRRNSRLVDVATAIENLKASLLKLLAIMEELDGLANGHLETSIAALSTELTNSLDEITQRYGALIESPNNQIATTANMSNGQVDIGSFFKIVTDLKRQKAMFETLPTKSEERNLVSVAGQVSETNLSIRKLTERCDNLLVEIEHLTGERDKLQLELSNALKIIQGMDQSIELKNADLRKKLQELGLEDRKDDPAETDEESPRE